jgi:hypothetical protein
VSSAIFAIGPQPESAMTQTQEIGQEIRHLRQDIRRGRDGSIDFDFAQAIRDAFVHAHAQFRTLFKQWWMRLVVRSVRFRVVADARFQHSSAGRLRHCEIYESPSDRASGDAPLRDRPVDDGWLRGWRALGRNPVFKGGHLRGRLLPKDSDPRQSRHRIHAQSQNHVDVLSQV